MFLINYRLYMTQASTLLMCTLLMCNNVVVVHVMSGYSKRQMCMVSI